ncbi:hypothetical protein [Methylobacterium sp. Leaf99]|uniref:hypothetical protein n=1 Tax=Methylobacterium sp. Leaf99 TaxID=1736251 RepID=UPI000AD02FA3
MTTTSARRRHALRPRAGTAATSLFVAGLAVSAAFGMLVTPFGGKPALAQSAANPNDQPTPGTVPSRDARAAGRSTGQVSAPAAIGHSTTVVGSGGTTTNPLDHLPAHERAATGGSRQR